MKQTLNTINARIAQLKDRIFEIELSNRAYLDEWNTLKKLRYEISTLEEERRIHYPDWQTKRDIVEKQVYAICWNNEFERWKYLEKHQNELISFYNNGEYDTLADFLDMLDSIFNISYELVNHLTQETLNLEDIEDTTTIWNIKPRPNRRFCNQYIIEIVE